MDKAGQLGARIAGTSERGSGSCSYYDFSDCLIVSVCSALFCSVESWVCEGDRQALQVLLPLVWYRVGHCGMPYDSRHAPHAEALGPLDFTLRVGSSPVRVQIGGMTRNSQRENRAHCCRGDSGLFFSMLLR